MREGLCAIRLTVSSLCSSSPAAPHLQPIVAMREWGPGVTRSSPFFLEASNPDFIIIIFNVKSCDVETTETDFKINSKSTVYTN